MIMTRFILFVLFAGKLFNTALPAQNSYTLTKAYSVMILGTSNLRNWKDSIGTVTGNMAADLNIDGSVNINSIRIKMEVRSIKSNIGTAMDKKTYRALKSDANPQILFEVTVPAKVIQVSPGDHGFSLNGSLTLAGVCRPVCMEVTALKVEQGKLLFEGSQTISMTDYGITPPTILFGTVKAHAQITIRFKTNFTNN